MLVVVDQFTANTSICSKRVQVRRITLIQDRELSKINLKVCTEKKSPPHKGEEHSQILDGRCIGLQVWTFEKDIPSRVPETGV